MLLLILVGTNVLVRDDMLNARWRLHTTHVAGDDQIRTK